VEVDAAAAAGFRAGSDAIGVTDVEFAASVRSV
jgi:hypothetical protein